MPVRTPATPTYSSVQMPRVPRSPIGRSREGFLVSSPRFATASKPV
jgi:hypothetical protein